MTTLTTVLGLLPLLFESSRQALFLKPTVITLSYGLGFGMVILLFLVPALLAVQKDIAGFILAFRRGLGDRRIGMAGRFVLVAATALSVAVVVGTTGYLAATNELHPWLQLYSPVDLPVRMTALLAMFSGIAAVLVVSLLAAVAIFGLRPRRN